MENQGNLKVYYSKPESEGKRKKFLYATLTDCTTEIENKVAGNVNRYYHTIYASGGEEIHLTTDAAFPIYKAKRLCVPKIVIIFDTIKQLEPVIEDLGWVL